MSFTPPPFLRRFLCGLAQAAALPVIIGLSTAQWLGVFVTYMLISGEDLPLLGQIGALLGVYVGIIVVTGLIGIALKWLVLGRTRPGIYPLWGVYYFRWWFAARVAGLGTVVASGTATAEATGSSSGSTLQSQSFALETRANGEVFTARVNYEGRNVTAFQVEPPVLDSYDRIPLERSQLSGVGDFLSAFVLKGNGLDAGLCDRTLKIFTGVERFDLNFSYAKDDVATSKRTGYQGPVVLCNVKYKPISGHYTTSEVTNSLAQDDRILIWFAPMGDSGYAIPYRVLLTSSMGDLSMVLTKLE